MSLEFSALDNFDEAERVEKETRKTDSSWVEQESERCEHKVVFFPIVPAAAFPKAGQSVRWRRGKNDSVGPDLIIGPSPWPFPLGAGRQG